MYPYDTLMLSICRTKIELKELFGSYTCGKSDTLQIGLTLKKVMVEMKMAVMMEISILI